MKRTLPLKVTTVLLDLDGTLLDSNDAHAEAWVLALKEFGLEYSFDEIRKLIGMGADHLLPTLLERKIDDKQIEKISKLRGEIFRERFLGKLKPFEGARSLVEKILQRGMKPVIATSASEEDLKGLLRQIGIEDLIHLKTTADDAERSKPSPDIIAVALQKAAAQPEEAVMIGDTPYDVTAASRCGVPTIAFTSGGWPASDFREAFAVYAGPAELVAAFDIAFLNS